MKFNELRSKWDDMNMINNAFILLDSTHPVEFNIGYENINQKTLFIMNSGEIRNLYSSKSIEVNNYQLKDGRWVLSFKLISISNEDVYLWFCWDMIESSRVSHDNFINFIVNRYDKWMRLMEHKYSDLMDISRQKGLIGELLHIEEMIYHFNPDKVIAAWTGPDGADQDFIYNNTWDEIKASSLASDCIKISSLEQLDMNEDGHIVVYFIEKTSEENANKFSLNSKVMKIRELCSEYVLAKDELELKLLKYGYRDNIEYDKQKYRLCKKNTYKVNSNFPRLVKGNLNSAIVQVEYYLNLPLLEKYLC